MTSYQEKTLLPDIATLSLKEKISQLTNTIAIFWDESKDAQKLCEHAAENGAGAVFFFCRDTEYMAEKAEFLRRNMKIPPLVCADFEMGPMGITDVVRLGDNMNIGAIADPDEASRIAYEAGKYTACAGRQAGVDWAFGPVVDIPYNIDCSMTNIRCYSSNIEHIRKLSVQYIKGMQEHGMAATLKHFPGDGTDARDQHITTSKNLLSAQEWMNSYAKTFSAGIQNGVLSIMMGHIGSKAFGTRDEHTGLLLPATIDPAMHSLLRKEMGFAGVIVSDALGMIGVRGHCRDRIDTFVRNLSAGSDMGLFIDDIPASVEGVLRALDKGLISENQIDASVERIFNLKKIIFETQSRIAPDYPEPQAQKLAAEISTKSLTIVRDFDGIYPMNLRKDEKIVICVMPDEVRDPLQLPPPGEVLNRDKEVHLAGLLRNRGYEVVCVSDRKGIDQQVPGSGALIYMFNSRPTGTLGNIRMCKQAVCCLDWDVIKSDLPVYFFSPASPFILWELCSIPNFVCGYSPTENVQEAYFKSLVGETGFPGILPVDIPE